MKVIVTTCDRYMPLLKGFSELFNKYWSEDQEVIVLCYEKPKFKLPINFTIYSMGKQSDFGKTYTDAMIPFFNSFKEEYFVLMMEDHFIVSRVNVDLLKIAQKEISENGVKKVWLGCWDGNILHKNKTHNNEEYSKDFIKWINNDKWTMGVWLDPSLWSTELWLRFLKPGLEVHSFEGSNKMDCRNLNPLVLYPKNDKIISHLDATHHGVFNKKVISNYRKNPEGELGVCYFGKVPSKESIDIIEKQQYEINLLLEG